jgi:protein phosphatase 1 regulatory subunit 7
VLNHLRSDTIVYKFRKQERITNPTNIDRNLIESELKCGKHVIIQFSNETYSERLLMELNDLCFRNDEYLGIRFFGHHTTPFDCKTVEKIPNIKSLYIDCLTNAENMNSLTYLQSLKMLSIGVFELKDTEILKADNLKKINILIFSETRTKAINLEYLKEYKDLNTLIICGHAKNIEAIGELSNLEFLSLNSISKTPINFVNKLKKLKTLKLILGGKENINEIEENKIETLEIIRVRGFKGLSNLKNFKRLRNLLIEDQIGISELNFDQALEDLVDLKVLNCKSLTSLTGLENLPSLKQLRISRTNIDFDSFVKQQKPESLKILAFYTSKSKIDREINERLNKLGYWNGLEKL